MSRDVRRFRCAEDLLSLDYVSRESLPGLETYVRLLEQWQKTFNLVSADTLAEVWHRHIADSLQLYPHIPDSAQNLLDLGSGAGFPGLPLALIQRHSAPCAFHLVESNAKKSAFLREVVRQTSARAVVHNVRIESLDSAPLQVTPDVVVSRALAPLTKLLEYAQKPLENGAIALFLKGRDVERELTEARKYWIIDAHCVESLTEPEACILKIKEADRVA